MKITDIEVYILSWTLKTAFWTSLDCITSVKELLVKVYTDEGIVGIGQAHGRGFPPKGAADVIIQGIKPLVVGQNPFDNEALWEKMFHLTYRKGWNAPGWSRAEIMCAIAGVDIALWDIKAKAVGVSVHRLLGGCKPGVHCYVMGGYYREDENSYTAADLAKDTERWVNMGYNAIKIKVAGVSIEEDIKRIKAIRDAIGYDIDLMLDACQGYSVQEAIRAIHAFEPYRIRWFEEPVHWYDNVAGLAKVAAATTVPIHSGENEMTRFGCRALIERGKIGIMAFDCTQTGGVTEWLKVAAFANVHNVPMAPHHDPQIHAHLVAAVPNGLTVETFPDGERDPLWSELLAVRPEIKNSYMEIPDKPGFGIELDEKVVAKRGTKVS
jgi:L-alanine-DL-glutamate epimerase-like enolase superfamily enzyme